MAGVEQLTEIREFLILHYAEALGSAVHAATLIEALRKAVPDASIAVASSGLALEVVRHNPYAERVIATPPPQEGLLAAARTIRREWRPVRKSPRCIITGIGSVKWRITLLSMLAGKALRVGHTLLPPLYHRAAEVDPSRSMLENNLRVLELLGYPYRHYEPRMFFSEDDLAAARALLSRGGLDGGRMVAMFITQPSGTQPTGWRDERFAAVADHMVRRMGARIVFTGTSGQADAIERIRSRMTGESVSLAGMTSVPVLAALLCLSDVAVTLDTGAMHLGRAVGLPMAVIAPAWQRAIEWLPLGHDRIEILRGPDIPAPPPDYAMDEVGIERVEQALDRLMASYPPLAKSRQARLGPCLGRTPRETVPT